MTGRRWGLVIGVVIAAGLVAVLGWRWLGSAEPAAATPPADEADLRARLTVTAEVTDRTLAATGAIADSLEEGVRGVTVRVVDELDLTLRLEAGDALSLPGLPFLCLVGPFSAPDDAGLSDRCWGEPDLAGLAAEQLPLQPDGTLLLGAGLPAFVTAELSRGAGRCDYPPGTWRLEVAFSPPGTPAGAGRLALEDVAFQVSPEGSEPLTLIPPGDSRYCGLATVVVREQGEPEVIPPSPAP